jgi:5-formyltetrahydrofolate cyclo-ligase
MTKSELRKDLLKQRMALAEALVLEKSAAILGRITALEEYRRAGVVMAYVDFRNEVRTGALIENCLAAGKRVTVPITDVVNKLLTPSEILNYPEDLLPGAWGILEPAPGCVRPVDPGKLDMVIVPGVAFDLNGDRLGYGGGFYDRFLPRTRPDTIFVAPAFELQIKENVYPGSHDCPVHILVTEERVVRFKGF